MFKKEKHLTHILSLVLLMSLSHALFAAESNQIGVRPILGIANGIDDFPVSDFVLKNTDSNEQVGDGTSYLSTGGGLLLGLELTYHLDSHSILSIGYTLKGNAENPGLNFLDATFTSNIMSLSYYYQRRLAGIDFFAGAGVAFHHNIRYSFEWLDESIPGLNYTLSYKNTVAPSFSIGLEKMTREGVALFLCARLHVVTYKGDEVKIEGIDNTQDLIPIDKNGNGVDFTLGATWYF